MENNGNFEEESQASTNETQDGFSKEPKQEKRKKTLKKLGTVGLAILIFVGGYLASALQYDEGLQDLRRIKQAIQNNYYEEITNERFYDVLFSAINEELLDPYSKYMTADEYMEMKTSATGKWSGIGVTFLTKDELGNKQMLVRRVSGNSPAERAGVVEGDFVVGYGVDENSILESNDYDLFYAFLGERVTNEQFFVKIRRAGTQDFLLALQKETFVESYVSYRTSTYSLGFSGANALQPIEGNNPLTVLDADTAYVRLTQFNGSASSEFKTVMERFKRDGKKHLVLDLRDNGGGYMNILQEIASYFCKGSSGRSTIAVAEYKNGMKELFSSQGSWFENYFSEDSEIKVLADSGTASASECLLGCMIDYGAINYEDICLIEEGGVARTYGKGVMQSTFPFGFGNTDAIKLTTARIVWPKSGNCIHGRGILPEDGAKTVKASYEKDSEILSALATLQ